MANAKVLARKQGVVAELTEKVKNAASVVLVDYKGINVAEDTRLRTEMRNNGIEYAVVKNTLLRFAMNANGYESLSDLLNGTTSVAMSSEDSIGPARVIDQFASKLKDKFEIKGGFVEGRILSVAELKAIAAIPSKEALLAQVLGTMLAPITALAFVLSQIAEKGGEAAPAVEAEAAPAVEAEAAPAVEAEAAPTVEAEAAPTVEAEAAPAVEAEAAPAVEAEAAPAVEAKAAPAEPEVPAEE